jgi:glycosyltransferase involved in cell wall biosynthesis
MAPARPERLSLVVPMWNEEDTLTPLVTAARSTFDDLVTAGRLADYELVLVDDASTDATPRLLDDLATADPRVRAVHHEHNRGLGGAIRSGLAATTGDLVLYTDADLPFDLAETRRLLDAQRDTGADVVIGFRIDRWVAGYRRGMFTVGYNLLVRLALGLRMRDVNFACKMLRRSVLDRLDLHSEGSFIDAELLARVDRMGFRITEVGLDYHPRTAGASTLSSLHTIRGILGEMRRLTPQIRRLRPRQPG